MTLTPEAAPLLDPRALRAGTTLRFALLLMAVAVASIDMVDTLLTPLPWHSAQTECQFAAGYDPNGNMLNELLLDQRSLQALARCAGGHPASYPYWRGLAGTAVLIAVAVVVYRCIPIWRSRRGRVVALGDIDADGAIDAELQRLTMASGLGSPPRFVVDPTRTTAGAVAFGRLGRYTVCLDGGLLPLHTTDPAAFGAVVRHELAHISNLDVDLTYAVVALWRAFAALVMLPYVLVTGVTFAMAQFAGRFLASDAVFWPASRPPLIRQIAVSLFLTLLVYLTTADILRHRELHADADAVAQGADRDIWDRAAEDERSTEHLRALMRWRGPWRVHPSWQKRARSLHDPAALFSLSALQLFLIGAVTSLSLKTLTEIWSSAFVTWLTVGATATLVTVAIWRSVLYAAATGAETPSGLRAGCWLGLGFTVGELLTAKDSVNRWLPPHPEVLLVLIIGAIGFTVWVTQCARLQVSRPDGVQAGFPPALCAAAIALAVTGLLWWQRSGTLFTMGNFFATAGMRNYITQSAPGPWHAHSGTLTLMTAVLPELAASVRQGLTVLITPVLWLYPLALWRRRGSQRLALRRTLTLGVAGGTLAWIGIAVVMASMHTWQPPSAQRAGAFGIIYLWWVVVVIWAAVAATGFAAALRSELWLSRALVASGVAVLFAIVGLFLSSSADGCLGPLRVMGDSCHLLPATGWLLVKTTLGELLLSLYGAMGCAVVAASIAHAVRRFIRHSRSSELPSKKLAAYPEPGGIANTASFRVAVAGVLAVTGTAFIAASADAGGVAASPTAQPPPQATTAKVRTFQLLMWWRMTGQSQVMRLTGDFLALDSAVDALRNAPADAEGNVAVDVSRWQALCANLARDANDGQQELRIPDTDLEQAWSTTLSTDGQASATCLAWLSGTGSRSGDDALSQLATAEADADKTTVAVVTQVRQATTYWPGLVKTLPAK